MFPSTQLKLGFQTPNACSSCVGGFGKMPSRAILRKIVEGVIKVISEMSKESLREISESVHP